MALAEDIDMRENASRRDDDLVLGDDFVTPDSVGDEEVRSRRERRGFFSLRDSSLTRKIVTFNLVALSVLVAGVLYLNSSRDSLAGQWAGGLVSEVELVADVFEVQLPANAPVSLASGDGLDVAGSLESLDLRSGVEVFVFDPAGTLAGHIVGSARAPGAIGAAVVLRRTTESERLSTAVAHSCSELVRFAGSTPS